MAEVGACKASNEINSTFGSVQLCAESRMHHVICTFHYLRLLCSEVKLFVRASLESGARFCVSVWGRVLQHVCVNELREADGLSFRVQ